MSENNIENNGGAPEAPKKKQIVHVFRPQNTQNAKQQGRRGGQQTRRDGGQPHPNQGRPMQVNNGRPAKNQPAPQNHCTAVRMTFSAPLYSLPYDDPSAEHCRNHCKRHQQQPEPSACA